MARKFITKYGWLTSLQSVLLRSGPVCDQTTLLCLFFGNQEYCWRLMLPSDSSLPPLTKVPMNLQDPKMGVRFQLLSSGHGFTLLSQGNLFLPVCDTSESQRTSGFPWKRASFESNCVAGNSLTHVFLHLENTGRGFCLLLHYVLLASKLFGCNFLQSVGEMAKWYLLAS